MKRICILKKRYLAGDFDNIEEAKGKDKLKSMRSKSIAIGTRGRQAYSDTSDIEDKLMEWLRGLWRDEKQVTQMLFFCHVMEINPDFLDGVHSANHFIRLKKWFYYGFTIRHNLSICKLARVRQRLPLDWKQKLKEFRSRVTAKQRVTTRPDESKKVEGVKDKDWFNTDHVLIW